MENSLFCFHGPILFCPWLWQNITGASFLYAYVLHWLESRCKNYLELNKHALFFIVVPYSNICVKKRIMFWWSAWPLVEEPSLQPQYKEFSRDCILFCHVCLFSIGGLLLSEGRWWGWVCGKLGGAGEGKNVVRNYWRKEESISTEKNHLSPCKWLSIAKCPLLQMKDFIEVWLGHNKSSQNQLLAVTLIHISSVFEFCFNTIFNYYLTGLYTYFRCQHLHTHTHSFIGKLFIVKASPFFILSYDFTITGMSALAFIFLHLFVCVCKRNKESKRGWSLREVEECCRKLFVCPWPLNSK